MITLYSGTPGSGKSYHACQTVYKRAKSHGSGIIANFPISLDVDDFRLEYWDNSAFSPGALVSYARENHSSNDEGQTLIILDEAQVIFNSRTFQAHDRLEWIKFFSQHRKLGYDVLLISQNDRMIDKQIRMLIEIEVKHRKINNYGFGGIILSCFGRLTWFVALRYWYGGNKLLLDKEMIRYKPAIAGMYDTMRMFDDSAAAGSQVTGAAAGSQVTGAAAGSQVTGAAAGSQLTGAAAGSQLTGAGRDPFHRRGKIYKLSSPP